MAASSLTTYSTLFVSRNPRVWRHTLCMPGCPHSRKAFFYPPPPTPHLDDTLLSFPVDTTFGRHHLLIPCRHHIWTTPSSHPLSTPHMDDTLFSFPVDTISCYSLLTPHLHNTILSSLVDTTFGQHPPLIPCRHHIWTTPSSHPLSTPHLDNTHFSYPCRHHLFLSL
ncbi:hypothetical protein Purlil1_13685 [Purpureocillium lilacinum]|uniref:Uncharacterized protein n=1 Tax=Purpureocillium lilacinum TaxID=33203 RepID=A0ABR0BDF4_PURLI|nr:hypothetical protein Purlil1_13685 [Purpureocillium lilacinum]